MQIYLLFDVNTNILFIFKIFIDMGVIRNIKESIDDKSSMSVNSITLLASALMGVVIGFVICFVLIYDVISNGHVESDVDKLAWLLISSGGYIASSGIPKAYVDGKIKTRSWVENEKMEIEAEEDLNDLKAERRRRRKKKDQIVDMEDDGSLDDNLENE